MDCRVAIDIGGTFTDLVLLDSEGRRITATKTLTMPDDPSAAVATGLRQIVQKAGVPVAAIEQVIHATTLVANALVERKGVRTALITTRGFGDVIEIGRSIRHDIYDVFLRKLEPLVAREDRIEISERVSFDGRVITPLHPAELERVTAQLRGRGYDSVAVVLLHSYANPEHELRIGEEVRRTLPTISVSLSHKIANEIREYERTTTTVANAFVQPFLARYIGQLRQSLRDMGVQAPIVLLTSTAGIAPVELAQSRPIELVESGPAGGALAGGLFGRLAGSSNVLAFDMGGTTAKACLVFDGLPLVESSIEVARVDRFKRGSGIPLRVASLDLIEIGAGGGSIARVDELGLLKVGPRSAGSVPGPACYGRGGDQPTVTDASVVLGHIAPESFLGGEMRLDPEAAHHAIGRLAQSIGIDTARTAAGIYDVVVESMAAAARVYIADKGADPRLLTLVATGGAGPLHACQLARRLGISRVVIPFGAGVASSIGFLAATPQVVLSRAIVARLDRIDWTRVSAHVSEMREEALPLLMSINADPEQVHSELWVDMRYASQGFELSVPVDLPDSFDAARSQSTFAAAFEAAHRTRYGHLASGAPIETTRLQLRMTAQDDGAQKLISALATNDKSEGGRPTTRDVYSSERRAFEPTPVFRRSALHQTSSFIGPAIVDDDDTTILVPSKASCCVDFYRNLVVDLR